MKTFTLLRNQKGFSLIEALVAMAILTIGLLAVGLMQIGAMKANTNALSRTDGVAVSQSMIDTLRSLPQDDPLLDDVGGDGLAGLDNGAAVGNSLINAGNGSDQSLGTITGPNGQRYVVFWNVATDTPSDNLTTIRLFTYWQDQRFGLNRVIETAVLGDLYL